MATKKDKNAAAGEIPERFKANSDDIIDLASLNLFTSPPVGQSNLHSSSTTASSGMKKKRRRPRLYGNKWNSIQNTLRNQIKLDVTMFSC